MPDTSQRRVAMSCGSRQTDLCGTLDWKKWVDKFCLAVSASLAVEGKYTDIWHNTGLEKHPLFCGGFISCFQEVSSTLLWANRLISYFDMLMLALLWYFHRPVTHHLAMAQTDWLRISSWTADFFTFFSRASHQAVPLHIESVVKSAQQSVHVLPLQARSPGIEISPRIVD